MMASTARIRVLPGWWSGAGFRGFVTAPAAWWITGRSAERRRAPSGEGVSSRRVPIARAAGHRVGARLGGGGQRRRARWRRAGGVSVRRGGGAERAEFVHRGRISSSAGTRVRPRTSCTWLGRPCRRCRIVGRGAGSSFSLRETAAARFPRSGRTRPTANQIQKDWPRSCRCSPPDRAADGEEDVGASVGEHGSIVAGCRAAAGTPPWTRRGSA